MDEHQLTHRDYARFAALPSDELSVQCELEAFHASGPGGQGVNTADSAVRLRHAPTGIVVVSREERSQLQNRRRCLEKLRAELARRSVVPKRRKKTRPTKGSIERRLQAKRRTGELKRLRRRPEQD
jgi:ribosome-associated protein